MSYDIKIYEKKGLQHGSHLFNWVEQETIRGLTEIQKITIERVLKRHNIRYHAVKVEKGFHPKRLI